MTDILPARQGVLVVTGAAQGIGRAIAERLLTSSATVAVVDRDEKGLREAFADSASHNTGQAHLIAGDISDQGFPESLVAAISSRGNVIRGLINNAGVAPVTPFLDTSIDQLRRMFTVNVESLFALTQAVIRHMLSEQVRGTIVNVGTANAIVGVAGTAAYSASKGAIHALTRALAAEVSPLGITVNLVAPGTVMTERVREMLNPDAKRRRLDQIPAAQFVTEDNVAAAVEFLLSDTGRFMTGQTLALDGGFSVGGLLAENAD